MIERGKSYYHEGKEYIVIDLVKMKKYTKNPREKWIDGVLYKRAAEINEPYGQVYTMSRDEFENKFALIDSVLTVGREIIAECAWKIAASYKVVEIKEDRAIAKDSRGRILEVSKNININNSVEKIAGGVGYPAHYFVLTEKISERLELQKILDKISQMLMDVAFRFQKIKSGDMQTTQKILAAQKDMEKVFQEIFERFDI